MASFIILCRTKALRRFSTPRTPTNCQQKSESGAVQLNQYCLPFVQNLYTHQCLTVLRHVGTLNNEIVHLPQILSALSASFRLKTNFSHIQRLHNMLYVYGATIIEIVRRKEFSKRRSVMLY
jgi:hypothetical protein